MSRFPHSSLPSSLDEACVPVPSLWNVGVPSALHPELPAAGRLRLGDVDLGAGRPAVARGTTPDAASVPVLWFADHPSDDPAAMWRRLVDLYPDTGLWPLLLTPLGGGDPDRPWDSGELEPVPLAQVDALHPLAVLARGWAEGLVPMGPDPYVQHLRPFGAGFPGLSAPLRLGARPADVPGDAIDLRGWARIGLVPCGRPADAIAAIGWLGAINSRRAEEVSAVLRSWEDRFGVVLAGLGFATLTLLVPHPPAEVSVALPVAAEMAALCPDVLAEDGPLDGFGYTAGGTIEGLARLLVDRPVWKLWWD
ncbi:DUF4253 domain-containing protein [Blastococcus sp. BMG 814]|uniref:DUF4253 domain-containing protein n=1 Tax=Blastococcus carthaginiensis TaxID=3050034 RepID=A0ABT9IFT2_9ACTN|nr:DUF4253 domain-containing protein [Blastococcus carthaginiensis]MDP5184426.1 DUF4253 domain-containing protein [Blastococcus carthaginiensis]